MTYLLRRTAIWIVLLLSFSVLAADAQDVPDDSLGVWQLNLVGSLGGSQTGYENWAEGGVNTFSISASTRGTARRVTRHWIQNHESRLGIGYLRSSSDGVQKSDDMIRLTSSFSYRGQGFFAIFHPIVTGQARTQFAPGLNYNKDPFGEGNPLPVKVSDFLAPGVFTQSLGLAYEEIPGVKFQLGSAAKETAVLIEKLRPLYGVPLDDPVRWEFGVDFRGDLEREILENIRLVSSIHLFAAYGFEDLPDMRWDNLLEIQANRWITTNMELVLLYDADISRNIQLKEVLSVGLSFALL